MHSKFSDFTKSPSETVTTWNDWKFRWFHETTDFNDDRSDSRSDDRPVYTAY